MKKQKINQIDMTKGNMLQSIISFSTPLLLSSVLQTLYNTVDSAIIGNFGTTDALAGVSASESPMLVLLSVMMGLSNGVSVLLSQLFGHGNKDRIKELIATASGFFTVSVVPLTACALLLIKPMLSFINIQGAAASNAQIYLLIVFGGLIGNFGYNLNSGILRGLGDSVSPLIFLAISCVVNIVLDLIFVVGLNWGVAGVALATTIAMLVSWLYSVWHIKRYYSEVDYHIFSLKMNGPLLKKTLSLSFPLMLNHGIFSLGFLLYYRFVNAFGAAFMAGYGIAGKLMNLIWLPVSSLGTAAVNFTGQNSGAGDLGRINKGVRLFLKIAIIINVLTSAASLLLGRQIFGLFSSDTAVIEAAYNYVLMLAPFYWIYAIIHILTSIMNGVGDVKVSTAITLIMFWAIRLPVGWYMSTHFPSELLHASYPISWVVSCILTVGYFMTGRWKRGIPTKDAEISQNSG